MVIGGATQCWYCGAVYVSCTRGGFCSSECEEADEKKTKELEAKIAEELGESVPVDGKDK
jgi:hypothetical protein